jgi:hypothetical protein
MTYGGVKVSLYEYSLWVLDGAKQLYTQAILPLGIQTLISLHGRLGGPRASGDAVKRRKIICLCQKVNHESCSDCSRDTILRYCIGKNKMHGGNVKIIAEEFYPPMKVYQCSGGMCRLHLQG